MWGVISIVALVRSKHSRGLIELLGSYSEFTSIYAVRCVFGIIAMDCRLSH